MLKGSVCTNPFHCSSLVDLRDPAQAGEDHCCWGIRVLDRKFNTGSDLKRHDVRVRAQLLYHLLLHLHLPRHLQRSRRAHPPAVVAQWVERRTPEPAIRVRSPLPATRIHSHCTEGAQPAESKFAVRQKITTDCCEETSAAIFAGPSRWHALNVQTRASVPRTIHVISSASRYSAAPFGSCCHNNGLGFHQLIPQTMRVTWKRTNVLHKQR